MSLDVVYILVDSLECDPMTACASSVNIVIQWPTIVTLASTTLLRPLGDLILYSVSLLGVDVDESISSISKLTLT